MNPKRHPGTVCVSVHVDLRVVAGLPRAEPKGSTAYLHTTNFSQPSQKSDQA
jgi:hypothetical protein